MQLSFGDLLLYHLFENSFLFSPGPDLPFLGLHVSLFGLFPTWAERMFSAGSFLTKVHGRTLVCLHMSFVSSYNQFIGWLVTEFELELLFLRV
jgi:hypothetical protein